MKNIIYKIIFALAFFSPLYIISCEQGSVTEEVTLSRMFRPAKIEAYIDSNRVRLTWTGIANKYVAQLSQDSLLFTTNLQQFAVGDTAQLIVDELLRVTRYSARVKSVSINGISADSGWKEITFVTK